MHPAGLAHTVICVQPTSKKDKRPQNSAVGAQVHRDNLLPTDPATTKEH